MELSRKVASAIFRGRAGVLNPTQRKPYWDRVWRCKFCMEKEHSTRHYILHPGTDNIFKDKMEREETFRILKTLEGKEMERKLKKLSNKISEQGKKKKKRHSNMYPVRWLVTKPAFCALVF